MSQELQDFYNAMQIWIDAGCPQGKPFVRSAGLCMNILFYALYRDLNGCELSDELRDQLAEVYGPDEQGPFNQDRSYKSERDASECYKNKARLAWVKEHAP